MYSYRVYFDYCGSHVDKTFKSEQEAFNYMKQIWYKCGGDFAITIHRVMN